MPYHENRTTPGWRIASFVATRTRLQIQIYRQVGFTICRDPRQKDFLKSTPCRCILFPSVSVDNQHNLAVMPIPSQRALKTCPHSRLLHHQAPHEAELDLLMPRSCEPRRPC
jgi:hypothetical protein